MHDMENNTDDRGLLPFDKVRNVLIALCESGKNGDFWLYTEDKYTAIISLQDGDIVRLRYRVSRGLDALKKIQAINKAKFKFQTTEKSEHSGSELKLPSTVEILKMLGVSSDDVNNNMVVGEGSTV